MLEFFVLITKNNFVYNYLVFRSERFTKLHGENLDTVLFLEMNKI